MAVHTYASMHFWDFTLHFPTNMGFQLVVEYSVEVRSTPRKNGDERFLAERRVGSSRTKPELLQYFLRVHYVRRPLDGLRNEPVSSTFSIHEFIFKAERDHDVLNCNDIEIPHEQQLGYHRLLDIV